MRRVPAGTTEIRVQAIVDGFSGDTTPLHFTVPFHTDYKTVSVNQTVTGSGAPLTLQRLVFTGSTLTVFFSLPLESSTIQSLHVDSITINGQEVPIPSGGSTRGGEILDQALMGRSGAWEINFMAFKGDSIKITDRLTWTFKFTVPK